jgi:hypothetical protein
MKSSNVAARIALMLGLSFMAPAVFAQGELQGSQERSITPGQTDRFSIALKKDQFLSVAVVQKGVDVGVTVFDPQGARIRVVDGSDGATGTESVTVAAESEGSYLLEVFALDAFRNPPPGRYEIRIVEIRDATEQELRDGRIRALMRARGLELLADTEQVLQQVRDPLTRAQFQVRSANLLWSLDDDRATRLMAGGMDSLNEIFAVAASNAAIETDDLRAAMQLRRQLLESLVSRQPELALTFLRTSRGLTDPDAVSNNLQWERKLELTAARHIVPTKPQRAVQIAEEVLKEGPAQELMDVVRALQPNSPDLASNLAREIMITLANQRMLADTSTGNLAVDLVQFVRTMGSDAVGKALTPLRSGPEFTNFYQKAVSEVISYSPPDAGGYTAERHAALSLARALAERTDEYQNLQADRSAALSRKVVQLSAAGAAQAPAPDINSITVEQGLSIAERSPLEGRAALYQQLATKAATEGDINRAQQIINEYLPPSTRQRALTAARRTAVNAAASHGNFDEALRLIQSERASDARLVLLGQIVKQIGPGLKYSTAASLLEQIRSMLDPSPRAEGEEEMKILLSISAALARFNPERASSIIEPLVDQFNDLSLSAIVMNGFRQTYYRNGDLTMSGNNLATLGVEFARALANLALTDTPRARATADRMRPLTVRMELYLEMAEKVIRPSSWSD